MCPALFFFFLFTEMSGTPAGGIHLLQKDRRAQTLPRRQEESQPATTREITQAVGQGHRYGGTAGGRLGGGGGGAEDAWKAVYLNGRSQGSSRGRGFCHFVS